MQAGADSTAAEPGTVFKLEVTGISSSDGKIMIALWDSYDKFREKGEPLRKIALDIKYSSVLWELNDLPPGEYMISVYHDRNGNGKLDFNFLHIPKEPWGFSNNARGTMGPPGWDAARFRLSTGVREMKITLNE
jgi:uncharacterized protein (DUF2141 family)